MTIRPLKILSKNLGDDPIHFMWRLRHNIVKAQTASQAGERLSA
jgi:hypothetical protein